MDMEISYVLDIIIEMWAIPHSNPTVFSPSCVWQFLSSGVALLPDPQIALEKIVQLTLPREELHLFPVYSVFQALKLISEAQAQKGTPLAQLVNKPIDDTISFAVRLEHFSIPCTTPEYFKEHSGYSGSTVLPLWQHVATVGDTDHQASCQSFDSIWSLIASLDEKTIDHDRLYIGVYFVRAHVEGCILPYSLPLIAFNHILSWFKESAWIMNQITIIPPTRHNEDTEDVHEPDAIVNILATKDPLPLAPASAGALDSGAPIQPPKYSGLQSVGKTKIDNAIRDTIDLLLGWDGQKEGCLAPSSPLFEDLDAYNKGAPGSGPTILNFRVDWEGLRGSGWNYTASYVFADYFLVLENRRKWPGNIFPPESLHCDVLATTFRSWVSRLRNQQKHNAITHLGTQREKAELRERKKEEYHLKRRYGRKHKRFDLRCNIILAHPDWPPAFWDVIAALGPDGTSSDETDSSSDEEAQRLACQKFCRVPKVWHNSAVESLLQYIDSAVGDSPLPLRMSGQAGQPFRIRIGDHPTHKNESVAHGFPENFYDIEWLNLKHPLGACLLGALPPIPDIPLTR
ncbi:hypothetical protein K439DRAFT_1619498 [Ramaria rubella]|nr:hypothetical protein K439DRAFT_1619498 [Ramaria rubella]